MHRRSWGASVWKKLAPPFSLMPFPRERWLAGNAQGYHDRKTDRTGQTEWFGQQ
jgi:hypothetical protein